MTLMQQGVTRALINTNRMATVAFIKNPDLQTPWVAMENGVRDAIGAEATRLLDATKMATALLGDSLATNVFLLGYAYQLGMIPVTRAALRRAIELNGAAVEANLRAFEWGRLACDDPGEVERATLRVDDDGASDRKLSATLDEAITRRVAFLKAYQGDSLAGRYRALVERVRTLEARVVPGNAGLTDAVARNYFKLLAIKDEYEVARLYTDGEFERQVAASFEGDYSLRYHFAPPLWVRPDRVTGVPRKRSYGAWVRPLLRALAAMRALRGSLLDPFGHTSERRTERRLVTEYEHVIDEIERTLRPDNHAVAVELAALPATIRGYGHVKLRNLQAARSREATLLEKLREPEPAPVSLAA